MTNDARPLWAQCWDLVRDQVCAVCLDAHDDGSCGLARGVGCALEQRMPEIVDALLGVDSTRMDEYYAAVERNVCATCNDRGPDGHCERRAGGRCALYAYLPLVVDALDEIRARRA
jgi:hypothetical protein